MIEIPLTQGYVALIDDEDADLAELKWYTDFNQHGKAYAVRTDRSNGVQRKLRMNRIILQRILTGYEISTRDLCDHKDRNSLNNQRENLRIANPTQNAANAKLSKKSSTGYKGVTTHKSSPNYIAQIRVNGHGRILGYFATPIEAAIAYNHAALLSFGEFAALNEIPDWQNIHPAPIRKSKNKNPLEVIERRPA